MLITCNNKKQATPQHLSIGSLVIGMVPTRGGREVIISTGGIIFVALDELNRQHRQQQEENIQLQDQLKAAKEGIYPLI